MHQRHSRLYASPHGWTLAIAPTDLAASLVHPFTGATRPLLPLPAFFDKTVPTTSLGTGPRTTSWCLAARASSSAPPTHPPPLGTRSQPWRTATPAAPTTPTASSSSSRRTPAAPPSPTRSPSPSPWRSRCPPSSSQRRAFPPSSATTSTSSRPSTSTTAAMILNGGGRGLQIHQSSTLQCQGRHRCRIFTEAVIGLSLVTEGTNCRVRKNTLNEAVHQVFDINSV
ncbi:hypothetical protein U9M48_005328, partial [Paspalum notatum var. saurae]